MFQSCPGLQDSLFGGRDDDIVRPGPGGCGRSPMMARVYDLIFVGDVIRLVPSVCEGGIWGNQGLCFRSKICHILSRNFWTIHLWLVIEGTAERCP